MNYKYIKLLVILLVMEAGNTLNAQKEHFSKPKRFSLSVGTGYMNEWFRTEGRAPLVGADLDQIFSPNSAYIMWVSGSWKFTNDFFVQFSYDLEKVREDDVNSKFWLRALHFSLGKNVRLQKGNFNYFLGISSIREVNMLYEITVNQNGEIIDYTITHAHNDLAFLHPHIGLEYDRNVFGPFSLGARAKVISNFREFARYDVSLMLTVKF